ncbi:hypothetical protein [Dyella mobilis]|nr:hypothetical protein [Dyella mobilis]
MYAITWTCPGAWWALASLLGALGMLLMLVALVRWRRRHARLEAQSRAERAALKYKANAEQESLLQSGQGMLLRFEAIARRLPPAHPIRKELAEALDRAEGWLEKGLDRAQHRRENKEQDSKPDLSD